MYEPAASRYLRALNAYAHQDPQMAGRLMDDHLKEAALAQHMGAASIARRHLNSVKELSIEVVRRAHKEWVRTGNKETFTSVVATLTDAYMVGVENDPDVGAVADEVFSLFEQGKVARDLAPTPVHTPQIPPATRKRRREPPITIRRVIPH